MGGIGKAVATRAKGFGMQIQYHNRTKLPNSEENGAKYVSFEELLKTSDVLSLNLALNPSTRHIISTDQFKMMKKGVTVINTGRGPLINEEALVQALDEGIVWSAGLDVYELEPEVHAKLLSNESVVLLPHIGTATVETQVRRYIDLDCEAMLTEFSTTWRC
jgi:lactate dehydrogenase-like 2-hydroxyacid dehydrogenase